MKNINISVFLVLLLVLLRGVAFSQASSDEYRLTAGLTTGGGGSSTSASHRITGAVLTTSGGKATSENYILNGGAPINTTVGIGDDETGYSYVGGGGGCLISTVAYGSRMAEEIFALILFLGFASVCHLRLRKIFRN